MTLRATATILGALALCACLHAPAAAQGTTLLVHGNYCGLGNNGPLPPLDALDAACARHDACTPDDDLPIKPCHLRLEREALAIAADPAQAPDLRIMAGLVATFASTAAYKAAPAPLPADVTLGTLRPAYAVLRR